MTLTNRIRDVLVAADQPMTPTQVLDALGLTEFQQRRSASASLRQMHMAGTVIRYGEMRGHYTYTCSKTIVSRLRRDESGFDDTTIMELMAVWPKRSRRGDGLESRP